MYDCHHLSGVTTAAVTMTAAMRDGPVVLAFLPLSCTPLPAVLVPDPSWSAVKLQPANKDPVHCCSQCAEGLLNTPITLDNDTMIPSTGGHRGWRLASDQLGLASQRGDSSTF